MAVAKVANTKGNLLQISRIRRIFPHISACQCQIKDRTLVLTLNWRLPLVVSTSLSLSPVLATLSRPLDFSPLVQLVQVLAVTRQKRRCTFSPCSTLNAAISKRTRTGCTHTQCIQHNTHTHTHHCAPEHAKTRELWLTRQTRLQTWEDARQATGWAQLKRGVLHQFIIFSKVNNCIILHWFVVYYAKQSHAGQKVLHTCKIAFENSFEKFILNLNKMWNFMFEYIIKYNL